MQRQSPRARNAETRKDKGKAYASRVVSRLDRQRSFANEQFASMSKWLIASLLAINGGGAINALSFLAKGDAHWCAAAFFVLGILAAMLNGVLLQTLYEWGERALVNRDDYWSNVSVSGVRDSETEQELRAEQEAANRFNFVAPLCGWVSGILFLAGAITLGIQLDTKQEAESAQCAAIKREMLASEPKRANSAQIYGALGCKQ